jgi:hypothetical protein
VISGATWCIHTFPKKHRYRQAPGLPRVSFVEVAYPVPVHEDASPARIGAPQRGAMPATLVASILRVRHWT